MADGTAERPGPGTDFDAVWRRADEVPGWLKPGQGRLLWDEAIALHPGATILEIGSHQGRSTVVLAEAARRVGATVVAVDPFVEGRLFGGVSTRARFESTLRANDLEQVVELVPDYSTHLRPGWSRPIDLLYVDGKHDVWTASDDLRWAAHLPEGGAVVVHDSFSSIGVTLAILRRVLFSSHLRYERRSDSQALFRRGRPTTADRLRIIAELPWWIRNVGVKVLLRLRLRRLARRLGHDSPYDPY